MDIMTLVLMSYISSNPTPQLNRSSEQHFHLNYLPKNKQNELMWFLSLPDSGSWACDWEVLQGAQENCSSCITFTGSPCKKLQDWSLCWWYWGYCVLPNRWEALRILGSRTWSCQVCRLLSYQEERFLAYMICSLLISLPKGLEDFLVFDKSRSIKNNVCNSIKVLHCWNNLIP